MSSHVAEASSLVHKDKGPEWYQQFRNSLSERASQLQLPEFFCGVLMAFLGVLTPGLPLPLTYAAIALVLLLAFTRRPTYRMPHGLQLWTLLLVLGLLFSLAVAVFGPYAASAQWPSRIGRITVVVILAFVMATGRVCYTSLVKGFIFMLALNVPLFYAGLVQDNYGGYLTGILNDKNQAGLNYALCGILILIVYKNKYVRWGLFILFATCLWLTGSRTSLAAYATALIWITISGRLNIFFKLVLAGGLGFAVWYVEQNLAQAGAFSDRTGTDELRQRIDDATYSMVQHTPWFGRGLGHGTVFVENRTFFFHNNYWGLYIEGGWPLAIIAVAFTVWVGTRIFAHVKFDERRIIAQGATLAMLVCAWKLGDVFFTATWALVMAVGIRSFIDEDGQALGNLDGRQSPRVRHPDSPNKLGMAEEHVDISRLDGNRNGDDGLYVNSVGSTS